jgi:hypothetical protein
VHGAAPVALRVAVRGVGGVDGVDARDARRGDDLGAGEVPEVPGVLDDRVEVPIDPGVQRRRQVAGAEDERLEPLTRPGDRHHVGEPLGVLDEHLERDPPLEGELRLQLGQEDVDPPDVAGRVHLGHDQHVQGVAGARDHVDDVAVAPRRVESVDADGAHGPAPVQPRERGDGGGARRFLGERRARVLQIEEHEVRAGPRRLLAHPLAAGGRRQLRSAGPGSRHGHALPAPIR